MSLEAVLRKAFRRIEILEGHNQKILKTLEEFEEELVKRPRSITEEIDAIPGRRIFYNLSDRLDFTIAQDGLRGEPLSFLLSQDGGYVMTHYPLVAWRPNTPVNATNFGQWSPVSSWPLPTQQIVDQDRIDLSYEIADGGSQRNFQNEPAAPLFSRPDNMAPLPVPTLFAPNTVINFWPTYEDIFFNPSVADQRVPTQGGELVVTLPGYRIVNM